MTTSTSPPRLESSIGRLLTAGTYLSVVLLGLGALAMLATGRSPLESAPALDLVRLPTDLVQLRPEGLLWLGLLAVILTPAARVTAALVGFGARGERRMTVIAALVLVVIILGVVLARSPEG